VRAKSKRTTLTSGALSPKEGEEVIRSGFEHHYHKKDFRIRLTDSQAVALAHNIGDDSG
jgi:hypothetical protein